MSQQSSLDIKANYTPHTNSIPTYNPNNEMNSSLYRNKRQISAPTNYIGIRSFRPANIQPVRTYWPQGISGVYNFTGPILHTLPVQPKYQ